MTLSQLKAKYFENNPQGFYFTYKNMKFYGDTMANYGVIEHKKALCFELYRKNPVNGGLQESKFFSSIDFKPRNAGAHLFYLAEMKDSSVARNAFLSISNIDTELKKSIEESTYRFLFETPANSVIAEFNQQNTKQQTAQLK